MRDCESAAVNSLWTSAGCSAGAGINKSNSIMPIHGLRRRQINALADLIPSPGMGMNMNGGISRTALLMVAALPRFAH
jgi:hypothetical protein